MEKLLAESLQEYRDINNLNETKSGKPIKVDQSKKDKYKESIAGLKKQLKDAQKKGASAHDKANVAKLKEKIAKFEDKLNEEVVYRMINEGLFGKKKSSGDDNKSKYVSFVFKKFPDVMQKNPKLKPFLEKQEETHLVDLIKQYKSVVNDQSSGKLPKFLVKNGKLLLGGVNSGKPDTGAMA